MLVSLFFEIFFNTELNTLVFCSGTSKTVSGSFRLRKILRSEVA